MDPNEKNRFDALELLRVAAYKSFNDRRSYEWKFCMCIWTAFAVYIGALVTQPVEAGKPLPVTGGWLALSTAIVSAVVVAIQLFWTSGLARANSIDIAHERDIRDAMYEALCHPKPKSAEVDIEKAKQSKAKLWRWSHGSELLLTALLGLVATIAALARHG